MKAQIPHAGELMNRSIRSVSPDMSLADLIEFLLHHEISCAPVIEGRGSHKVLIGFVSEADALEHLSNKMFYGLPEPKITVATCMKRHPVSVFEDTDVFAIASLLVNHGYRHLPVVNKKDELLGLVSRREALQAMRKFYNEANLEHDREAYRPDLTKIMNHRFILSQ